MDTCHNKYFSPLNRLHEAGSLVHKSLVHRIENGMYVHDRAPKCTYGTGGWQLQTEGIVHKIKAIKALCQIIALLLICVYSN